MPTLRSNSTINSWLRAVPTYNVLRYNKHRVQYYYCDLDLFFHDVAAVLAHTDTPERRMSVAGCVFLGPARRLQKGRSNLFLPFFLGETGYRLRVATLH